ncbi:hypothetical protein BHU25_13675 [Pseudomonas vranovensis]|uniref:Uncharacterized protein n=1 Tax=Pseudomonas vranovensis TaxID=321661 RepID=A0A423DMS5_9PSED|nr:hypothetical protein BHU25_13675 [Pseudomonas vranovensis]
MTYVLLLLLNLAIGWWNCRVIGEVWDESKFVGGYMRVLVWCAAVQSAVAFSSVLVVLLGIGAYLSGHLTLAQAEAVQGLWYLLVIFPAVGTGLVLTINSLITAWRERSMASIGVAAWNTFSTLRNLHGASEALPKVWEKVSNALKDNKNGKSTAIIVLALLAVLGGVVLTAALIRYYARRAEVPMAVQA